MDSFVSTLPTARLNWFDGAAIALLLIFAWQGYRRGALGWLAAIGASLLALAGAFVLAPEAGRVVAGQSQLGRLLAERVSFVVLLIALRLILGWVMHELVAAVRSFLWALQPLGLIDRLLGVIPSLALGSIVVLLVLVAAILLPVDHRLHDAAISSYLGQVAAIEAVRAGQALPRGGLMSSPERILDVDRALAAIQSIRSLGGTS